MEYFWIIYEYLEEVVHPKSISVAKARAEVFLCGTVSSIISGLETRSLGLNTLGTT